MKSAAQLKSHNFVHVYVHNSLLSDHWQSFLKHAVEKVPHRLQDGALMAPGGRGWIHFQDARYSLQVGHLSPQRRLLPILWHHCSLSLHQFLLATTHAYDSDPMISNQARFTAECVLFWLGIMRLYPLGHFMHMVRCFGYLPAIVASLFFHWQ